MTARRVPPRARDDLDRLADAAGEAVGQVRREIDALCDATGIALGDVRQEIAEHAAELAPALAASRARAVALAERHAETFATVGFWLSRCCDDAC